MKLLNISGGEWDMKKWQKNPWKVCMEAKKYHVIINNINGSQTRDSKEFNRFEDAKEFYFRMRERKDCFVYFGTLNKKDGDIDIIYNFVGSN